MSLTAPLPLATFQSHFALQQPISTTFKCSWDAEWHQWMYNLLWKLHKPTSSLDTSLPDWQVSLSHRKGFMMSCIIRLECPTTQTSMPSHGERVDPYDNIIYDDLIWSFFKLLFNQSHLHCMRLHHRQPSELAASVKKCPSQLIGFSCPVILVQSAVPIFFMMLHWTVMLGDVKKKKKKPLGFNDFMNFCWFAKSWTELILF